MSSISSLAPPLPEPSRDLLSAVIEFVWSCSYYPPDGLPQLPRTSFVRAWQSLAQLPEGVTECCIVTDLSQVRHGTNTYVYRDSADKQALGSLTMGKLIEHQVQVDFMATDPQTPIEWPRARAGLVECIANSTEGNALLKRINPSLSLMYCDDVQSLPEMDEAHNLRSRHFVVLHIGQNVLATLPQEFFEPEPRAVNVAALPDNPTGDL